MKTLAMTTWAMTVALAGSALAQDTGMKARELFYTPPPDASTAKKPAAKNSRATRAPVASTAVANAPAKLPSSPQPSNSQPSNPTPSNPNMVNVVNVANVPLGLRYSVLKRDASGKFAEVDSDTTFRSGDRIRLHVDTNTTGYLYVVMQGSSGNWRLLFPSSDVEGGSNRIEKGSSQQIPAGDRGQFVFDQQAGTEKLFLVLSRKPEPDLDKLIYSITGARGSDRTLMAQATVSDELVNRLRDEVKARDLVFEKVDSTEPSAEKATYVVNPSRTDDARLVVDVALKHGK